MMNFIVFDNFQRQQKKKKPVSSFSNNLIYFQVEQNFNVFQLSLMTNDVCFNDRSKVLIVRQKEKNFKFTNFNF